MRAGLVMARGVGNGIGIGDRSHGQARPGANSAAACRWPQGTGHFAQRKPQSGDDQRRDRNPPDGPLRSGHIRPCARRIGCNLLHPSVAGARGSFDRGCGRRAGGQASRCSALRVEHLQLDSRQARRCPYLCRQYGGHQRAVAIGCSSHRVWLGTVHGQSADQLGAPVHRARKPLCLSASSPSRGQLDQPGRCRQDHGGGA